MRTSSGGSASWAGNGLGWLLGAAVFGYLLAYPRVLGRSDESLVLYGAKRILQGQAIYRDFFEFLTPGSFYFFAAMFAFAGVSFQTSRVTMAVVIALSAALLCVLARRVASWGEATLAAVVFAAVCFPVWPYASPHWLSTALSLAAASVLLGGDADATRWRAAAAGALAGLTFAVQQNRGVVLGLWVVTALAVLTLASARTDRWRRCVRDVVTAGAGGLATALPIIGYSMWRSSPREVFDAIFGFVFGSYLTAHAGTVAWASGSYLGADALRFTWPLLLRSFPAALALETVALAWTLRRQRSRDEAVRACLLLLAAGMAAAILYYPDFIHVATIAPFALVVEARLLFAITGWRGWRRIRLLAAVPAIAIVLALAFTARKGWDNLREARAGAPVRFESAFGTLDGGPPQRRLLERIWDVAGHDSPVMFAYPSEAWLYLAAPADNPTRFSLLLPRYNPPAHFHEALDTLEARQVPYLVLNRSWLKPDDSVLRYLPGHYEPLADVGPFGGLFTIYGRVRQQ